MSLTVTDQIRDHFLAKANGSNYIACTKLADLAPPKMNPTTFITTFYQMKKRGEVDTDLVMSGSRKKVQGITLLKMPSATTILHNDATQKKMATKPKKIDISSSIESLENVVAYRRKKNVLLEISEKLSANGFIPENVLNVEPDPLGEEALILLGLVEQGIAALNQTLETNHTLALDLQAEKAINARYAARLKLTPENLAASNVEGQ